MLKISTKGRYGLRAMLDLARSYNEGPVMMSAITKRQAISRKYLHALLTSLKKAGLISAQRGAKGGFLLNRAPSTIYISEICEALEGKLAVVDCVLNKSLCERVDICETRQLWNKLNDQMMKILQTTTLADLLLEPTEEGAQKLKDGCAPAPRRRSKSV